MEVDLVIFFWNFPKIKIGGGGGMYTSQVPEILIIETTLYLISPQ